MVAIQVIDNFVEVTLKNGVVIAGEIETYDDKENRLFLKNWSSHPELKDIQSACVDGNEVCLIKEYGINGKHIYKNE